MRKLLLAGLVFLAVAGSAVASGDKYGALAYDAESGGYGWAVDADSQEEADEAAAGQCGCDVVMQFKNTCAAFALGSDGAYGWAYAPTKEGAQNKAMGYCRESGSGCAVKVWACTTR